jgi:hypothetical protein
LEQEYLDAFFALQLTQWENYACDAGHDLSVYDRQLWDLLRAPAPDVFAGRKAQVWEQIRLRGLVDRHPQVAALRNKLDDRRNYSACRPGSTGDEDDAAAALAAQIRPDVLELIRLRNTLSSELGHASYLDLALFAEELEETHIRSLLTSYLTQNLTASNSGYPPCPETGLSPDLSYDPDEMLSATLTQLGLSHLAGRISLAVRDQPWAAGYTGVLRVPGDVRVLVRPGRSARSLGTLLHEIGHAIAHASNQEQGLYQTWSQTHDEVLACIFARAAAHAAVDEQTRGALRAAERDLNVRCAVSALFEFDLWGRPERADGLYAAHHAVLGVPISAPGAWVLDSFRSIDPVCVHAYALGDVFASRVTAGLEGRHGHDYRAWGRWLAGSLASSGRRESLWQKISSLGAPGPY